MYVLTEFHDLLLHVCELPAPVRTQGVLHQVDCEFADDLQVLQYHRRDFAALTGMFYKLLSVVVECESAFVDVGVGRVFTQPP
jgi:hypothetical protein